MSDKNKDQWPESHYDLNVLGRWFFVVSLLLLVTIALIFHFDFHSEWKSHQKTFRKMEAKQTKALLATETDRVEAKKEYKKAVAAVAKEEGLLKEKRKEHRKLLRSIEKAQDQFDKKLSAFQYAKADYDATKYKFEAAKTGYVPGSVDDLEVKFERFRSKKVVLDREAQQAEVDLKELQTQEKALLKNLKDKQRSLRQLTKQQTILDRKLKKVDIGSMDIMNQLGTVVRDAPVLDMLNPYYKIDQIVVKDLKDDLNFVEMPKVDRCTSCHTGIMKKGFENAEQPYQTHPDLELYLSSSSAHPIEEFACTSCHQGRGRGTSFDSAAHTPSSHEQAKEWEEKYGWKAMHHWDEPMFPKKHIQASCLKCHDDQVSIKGADQLNLGLKLVEQSGCYGCHKIDHFSDYDKSGPNLRQMKNKLIRTDWVHNWIKNPQAVRKNSWMPQYFNQENNHDTASLHRADQEVYAMSSFLYKQSNDFEMVEVPVKGDAVKGKELVASLGCYGCHQEQANENIKRDLSLNGLLREAGPNLIGLGSKTNEKWIYNWLKNPKKYHPATAMPDMRLTDQEAANVAAHLIQDTHQELDSLDPLDHKILNEINLDFMGKMMTNDQAKEKLNQMSTQEKLLYSGEKLVTHYGCAACHEINGMDKALPIGPELNGLGSKSLHKFDFGFEHIGHTKHEWLKQKVQNPRAFDHGKILEPLEKLIMPNFDFSDEEADAVVTVLLGLVKKGGNVKTPEETVKRKHIVEGQHLIRQMNCQGCHLIEGDGAALEAKVVDWLVEFEGKSANDAKSLANSFSAPNLIGEGKKVHSEWLFKFLHEPTTIRPWLSVRMPSYDFDNSELNTLVKYFAYYDDQEFPFSKIPETPSHEFLTIGNKLGSADYFDCGNCHIQGDKMPAGTPDRWAPNFALAKERLKPEWIVEWLYDPQALLPGTKMPTYFDPEYFDYSGPDDVLDGDEHKQIQALKDYVIYGAPKKKKVPSVVVSTE